MRDSKAWAEGEVDLTNCDREPIHLLGQVQDYGCLLAVSPDWIVQHASVNVSDMLGLDADAIIGTPLDDSFPADATRLLRARLQGLSRDVEQARMFGVDVNGRRLDVSLHLSGRSIVIEFEPHASGGGTDELSRVQQLLGRVRSASTVEAATHEAARVLRALTGFDRVMVYRFEADGSGTVVSEATAPGVEGFRGLRFPASDVPKQARALYLRSLLRLIGDVNGPVHDIVPPASPEGVTLDLSLATTRAVSPIHLEYLRNMGVVSSMSVSILRDGALWGLFACHGLRPHRVGFERRTGIELFAQLFSYELARKEGDAEKAQVAEARALHDALIGRVSRGDSLLDDVAGLADEIAGAIDFDGLAVFSDDRYATHGRAPTREEFLGLARYLNTAATSEVFATDALRSLYPDAAEFRHAPAGLLALPISRTPRDYIVLFRDEAARSVEWAGNPDKPVEVGPNGIRLTPRESFGAWTQAVTDRSAPWTDAERAAANALRITLLEVVLKLSDEANAERVRAAERQDLLIAELNHRVRNILGLIRGLVGRTGATATDVATWAAQLDGRIGALARAHDQLTTTAWTASSLRRLVEVEFAPYGDGRLVFDGADARVVPAAYSTLALVIHELTTNSAKYGALSAPSGTVRLAASRDEAGALVVDWREEGGPVVQASDRRGFGSTIIERSIPYELGGTVEMRFRPTGVEGRFVIPARHVEEGEERPPAPARDAGGDGDAMKNPAGSAAKLSGSILLVEDNMIIAMDTADTLEEAGLSPVHTTSSVEEALASIEREPPALALLDVNLGAETSLAVAKALAERGIRFALTTGYGDDGGVLATFPPAPVLRKPYTPDALVALVRSLMA